MVRKKVSDKLAMENATKTLLANIRFTSIDNPIKTITITSSRSNEGKTTVACNLATAAATSGRHVVLVECDMRHRSIANAIGIHGARGLYSVLSGRVSLDDAVTPTKEKNLDFLDVEPGIPNPPDVIASKRFRKLVKDLREDYDLAIFDTPPVGGFVDAAELAALTDGTLFVVRENFTRRDVAQDALGQLRKAGANVLGSVLNCYELTSSGYYDYYYRESEAETSSEQFDELPGERHGHRLGSPASEARGEGIRAAVIRSEALAADGAPSPSEGDKATESDEPGEGLSDAGSRSDVVSEPVKDDALGDATSQDESEATTDSRPGRRSGKRFGHAPAATESPSETGSFLIAARKSAAHGRREFDSQQVRHEGPAQPSSSVPYVPSKNNPYSNR